MQCILGKAADKQEPPAVEYSQFGWEKKDGVLHPLTGVKVTCTAELLKVVACGCASAMPCSRTSCSCKSAGLLCTSYCKCLGGLVCHNDYTVQDADDEISDEEDDSSDEEDVKMSEHCKSSSL